MQKVQSVAHLASEAVHPLAQLSGILVQPSAELDQVALFALRRGVWSGPALYSIVGMRLANERSGSSSLFAHPFALEPVPLEGTPVVAAKDRLEARLEEALSTLAQTAPKTGVFADVIGPPGVVHSMVLPAFGAVYGGDDLCRSGWGGGPQATAARYLAGRG